MVSQKPYSGLFITLEGGEGAGKTVVAEQLAQVLEKEGYEILKTREPGNTQLSEELRKLILHTFNVPICEEAELLIYLASRAQHLHEKVLPALNAGKVVICDRFNDSSVAYQGGARKLGMDYVEKFCAFATHDLVPDFTLLLDVDPEVGMKRVVKERATKDRLESEALQFHREVREAYLHLADKYPERITIIDASEPLEVVVKASLSALKSHLFLKPKR